MKVYKNCNISGFEEIEMNLRNPVILSMLHQGLSATILFSNKDRDLTYSHFLYSNAINYLHFF